MGILKGTIYSKMYNSKIPNNSILKISLIETYKGSPAIKLIGKLEVSNPQSFPIKYELEYDDNETKKLDSTFYLNVLIKKERANLFSNESKSKQTSHDNEYGDFLGRAGRMRRHLDIYLNTCEMKIR